MQKEEVVWGSCVQIIKAKDVKVLKLTCSSLFIGSEIFFAFFNIAYHI